VEQDSIERFEAVALPHLDAAYTLARYLMRDDAAAQDVVQEAFLRALKYFDRYKGGDARAWVLAIVRNTSHTWRKREGGGGDPSNSTSACIVRRSRSTRLKQPCCARPTAKWSGERSTSCRSSCGR